MQILKNELINEIKERSSYLKQTHLYRGLNNKSIDELRFYIYELRQTKSIKENWENRFNVDQEGPYGLTRSMAGWREIGGNRNAKDKQYRSYKTDLEHISSVLLRTINNIENNQAEKGLHQLKAMQRNLNNNLKEDDNE